jgi:glycerophosphoryl diester phosphodiesterase
MNPLLDPAVRLVIGHRGAAAYRPENTLESFRLALAQGADALEFDVRRSADGVAMVFHDPTLERTTDAQGPLAARTATELQALDAGYRFSEDDGATLPFRGRGVRIPTLTEVITGFPGTPFLIEIKEAGVQEAVAEALLAGGAAERSVVAGNDWRALRRFREPPFHLGASRRDIARLYFGVGAPDRRCRNFAVPDSYYGLPIPTRRFVRAARRLGASVHVWTVDDARSARRWWRNGASGIVTNRPDAIAAARRLDE